MARPSIQNPHVELSVTKSNDQDLHTLVAKIKQAAGTSSLVQGSQLLQGSLVSLLAKDVALSKATTDVEADRAKLDTDLATETTCRNDLQVELRAFAAIAECDAKSPADLQGAGLPSRAPITRSTMPPEVPAAIDTTIPSRGRGKVYVSVHETTKGPRQQYVAQYSPEPYGPTTWVQLGVGHGKRRTLTGASGAKIWVRFAAVRGDLQSDWSTPVLVTIP